MYKIAVIGDRDSIYGYAALGLETFPVSNAQEASQRLKKLADGQYAIIYITEKLLYGIDEHMNKYKDLTLPAIIGIPDKSGNSGYGVEKIKKSVEKAIGADILFKNE